MVYFNKSLKGFEIIINDVEYKSEVAVCEISHYKF